ASHRPASIEKVLTTWQLPCPGLGLLIPQRQTEVRSSLLGPPPLNIGVGGEFPISPEFRPLRTDTIVHAASDNPHSSSDHNGFAYRSPWRCAGRRRGVRS